MSNTDNLWKEIDGAIIAGYIHHMEEVSRQDKKTKKRIFGTKIWFSGRVSTEKYEKVAHYIRKNYQVNVDQNLPFCIVIWDIPKN